MALSSVEKWFIDWLAEVPAGTVLLPEPVLQPLSAPAWPLLPVALGPAEQTQGPGELILLLSLLPSEAKQGFTVPWLPGALGDNPHCAAGPSSWVVSCQSGLSFPMFLIPVSPSKPSSSRAFKSWV